MKVKIYKPGKSAMQSGLANTHSWILEYETESGRVPEPLMGWVSSEDTLNQVRLKFSTSEDAVAFANEKGWEYTVLAPREPKHKPRNYGDNFRYIPVEEGR